MSYKQGDILQLSYSINVWKNSSYNDSSRKNDELIEHIPMWTTFLILEVRHHETYSTLRILTSQKRTGWIFVTKPNDEF